MSIPQISTTRVRIHNVKPIIWYLVLLYVTQQGPPQQQSRWSDQFMWHNPGLSRPVKCRRYTNGGGSLPASKDDCESALFRQNGVDPCRSFTCSRFGHGKSNTSGSSAAIFTHTRKMSGSTECCVRFHASTQTASAGCGMHSTFD